MNNFDFLVDSLYRIARIRAAEQAVWDLSGGKDPKVIGSVHLCAGQEAVPVGALAGLTDTDQIISTYRGHGWAIESGLTLEQVIGEVCHRSVGINQGRGGSAYMMAPHKRFIGENSIVGAGVPMACGVAMANLREGNDNVVLVSIGDGAMNQGSVSEAMSFAKARNLPMILICENNGWAEMTKGTVINKVEKLTRRAASFGIQALSVDGTDALAVRDAVKSMAARARAGEGPAMIECAVPRLWGHYNRDIEHYRPKADKKEAEQRDPLENLKTYLVSKAILSSSKAEELITSAQEEVAQTVEAVLASAPLDPDTVDLRAVTAEPDAQGTSPTRAEPRELTYAQALNEALRQELQARSEVAVYGEDVGFAGGIFGVTRNLQKEFGEDRVFDTPIAEAAILGSAVGAAMQGMRPVVEIMWADFMLVALDQLINQAANIRSITGGKTNVPMVMRTQQGATPGSCAQHSQCLEALLAHIPGLKVGLPATAQDAYDMLRSAIADPDPCVMFEAREFYMQTGPVETSDTAEPVGKARLRCSGNDVAIVTWGTMVPVAMEAAAMLKEQGVSASVLDLRWLVPMDTDALMKVVRKAGNRVVVLHEANKTGGFGAEVLACVYEAVLHSEKPTVTRVAMPDVRVPAAPQLMKSLRPNAERVVQAVKEMPTFVAKAMV
ncbi:alpha-ketoacid dehydrogenase subunit alpha/beta [Ruegeria jejuensis]|uniref:alpha-ketoacid dehydrogenase subunit alpha/beta n=1 Tax=Ruegeria jejuensis TaxID=3233338 RepID=UPI00355B019F